MDDRKLKLVDGDPLCDFEGAAGGAVTLAVVGVSGSALTASASFAGRPLISAPADKISFVVEPGVNDLSMVFTFSNLDARAELHETYEGGGSLLDDSISPVNNARIYHVRGIRSSS